MVTKGLMSVRPLGARSVARMRERDTRIVVVPRVKLPAEAEAAVAAADDGDGQPRNSGDW